MIAGVTLHGAKRREMMQASRLSAQPNFSLGRGAGDKIGCTAVSPHRMTRHWSGWPSHGCRIGEASHPGPADAAEAVCLGCSRDMDHGDLLLCDGPQCEAAWHRYCLPVPLHSVPVGDWFCMACMDTQPAASHDLPHNASNSVCPIEGLSAPRRPWGTGALRSLRRRLTLIGTAGTTVVDDAVGTTLIGEDSSEELLHEEAPLLGPLRCPLCEPFSTNGPTRALMLHITRTHGGETLDALACGSLHRLGRGVCENGACGWLNPLHTRCRQAGCSANARRLRDGDVVPRSAAVAEAENAQAVVPMQNTERLPAAFASPAAHAPLPADFEARAAKLPSNGMERIPPQFRKDLCELTAVNIEGMNAGNGQCALLEEASSKLLLGHIPKGASTPAEMRARLALYTTGDFNGLLQRAEAQFRTRSQRHGVAESSGQQAGLRGRTRRNVKAGAYRKAVQGLEVATARLTADEEAAFATELLPHAGRAGRERPPLRMPPDDMPVADEASDLPKPLEGVRFGPKSGPGPSGRRPEHIRDMLSCSRRRIVNRLLAAIAAAETMAERGDLPDSWRWVLNTRLVFLKKKTGTKPRPVRVGEVWRRILAKHSLSKHLPRVRKIMLAAHQYGVAVPGGAEILVHTRNVAEEAIRRDASQGVWAFVDVDLVNCFPSLEWDDVEEAVDEAVPELSPWTRWCHDPGATIDLPAGGSHQAARGAEQGDPHGSLQAALVLARRVFQAEHTFKSQGDGLQKPFFSSWLADDGQCICRPEDVDAYLASLDKAMAQAGATRGEGRDVKSVARLVGHSAALQAFATSDNASTWLTERVTRTCRVQEPNSPLEVLGAMVGPGDAQQSHFKNKLGKVAGLHQSLLALGDPPVELVLGRMCGDVARVAYLLRVSGHALGHDALQQHDDQLRTFLDNVLAGGLHDTAWEQASVGVKSGGLGFRRAERLSAVAFVASRIEARPFVERMFRDMAAQGVTLSGCMELYDAEVHTALQLAVASLDEQSTMEVMRCCSEGAASAVERLNSFLDGSRDILAGSPVGSGHAGTALVSPVGAEDEEHRVGARRERLQHKLSKIVDTCSLDRLVDDLTLAERWADVNRLTELRDETVSHDWLWVVGTSEGGGMCDAEFLVAAKLRLGADHASEPMACQCCGRAMLQPDCTHALCCAPGPSKQGHDDVRDELLDFVRLADATAEPEVLGLIACAPGLRPADILTSALARGRETALDVGVASPDSQGAGSDCLNSLRRRKLRTYAAFAADLEASRVDYRPLPWSCYGREHPDTTAVLVAIAQRAARRQGCADHKPLLARARAAIGVALARRGARMVMRCLRRPETARRTPS